MQSTSNNVIITCKVAYQAEIRRFTLERAEFIALRDQLFALFPQLEKETVVIKYTDDEKDLVTISSDEELLVALKLSNNFLRLTINPPQPEKVENRRGPWRSGCNNGASNPWEAKVNKKFHKQCDNPHFQQHRIARMAHKREKLAARLAYLEALPPNGNEAVRFRHQEKLRRKLNYLTNCLANQPLQAPENCPKGRGFHHQRWADPECRQGRIAHMTRHKEKLAQRLADLEALPPNEDDVDRIHRKEKLSAKLRWITERLENMSNCNGQRFAHPTPQNPEAQHADHFHPHPHAHHFPHPHPHAHLHVHPHAHFQFHAHPKPVEHQIGSNSLEELAQLRSQIEVEIAELKIARRKLKLQESSESESSSSEESEEVKRAKEEIRERIMELKKLRRSMKQSCNNDQKQYKHGLKHEARAAKKAEARAAKRLACLNKQEARFARDARRARKHCATGCEFPKEM